jgi:hypothetical protein
VDLFSSDKEPKQKEFLDKGNVSKRYEIFYWKEYAKNKPTSKASFKCTGSQEAMNIMLRARAAGYTIECKEI